MGVASDSNVQDNTNESGGPSSFPSNSSPPPAPPPPPPPSGQQPNYNGIPSSSTGIGTPESGTFVGKACLGCVGTILAFFLLLLILWSPNPWYSLLFMVLAILPSLIIGLFIKRYLQDDAVPASFLWTQFFFGAIPLIVIVLIIELIFSVIILSVLLNKEFQELSKFLDSSEEISDEDLINKVKAIVPLYKFILIVLIMAFVVAALVEEAAKWILARRYQRVDLLSDNQSNNRHVSVRGIIAVASAGALGLATVENVAYVLGLSSAVTKTVFPFRRIGLTLLRDVLAFPVHVCNTSYIALAAAQRKLFGGGPSVYIAFLVAVAFHGTFDAVSLVSAGLIAYDKLPNWFEAIVVIIQIALVIALVVLCRTRFKSLLERERAINSRDIITIV